MVNWSELLSWLSATKEEQSLGYELGRFRNLGCRPVSIVMVGFSDPVPKVFPVPPSEIHWPCWQLRWVTYGFSFVFLGNGKIRGYVSEFAAKRSNSTPLMSPFYAVLEVGTCLNGYFHWTWSWRICRWYDVINMIDTWRLIMHRWWHWDTHILHSTLFLLASMNPIEHAAEVDHGKII